MQDADYCETCGLPSREWSGRRNDYTGLSSMWAKRAHAAEADADALARAVSEGIKIRSVFHIRAALDEYLSKHPWSDL